MLTVLLALLLMTTLFTMTTTMAQQPPCGFDLRDLTACEPNKRRPPRSDISYQYQYLIGFSKGLDTLFPRLKRKLDACATESDDQCTCESRALIRSNKRLLKKAARIEKKIDNSEWLTIQKTLDKACEDLIRERGVCSDELVEAEVAELQTICTRFITGLSSLLSALGRR